MASASDAPKTPTLPEDDEDDDFFTAIVRILREEHMDGRYLDAKTVDLKLVENGWHAGGLTFNSLQTDEVDFQIRHKLIDDGYFMMMPREEVVAACPHLKDVPKEVWEVAERHPVAMSKAFAEPHVDALVEHLCHGGSKQTTFKSFYPEYFDVIWHGGKFVLFVEDGFKYDKDGHVMKSD